MLLIDLNPFSHPTDPLLFTWEELGVWEGPATILLVESGLVQPSALHSCRVPKVCPQLLAAQGIPKIHVHIYWQLKVYPRYVHSYWQPKVYP